MKKYVVFFLFCITLASGCLQSQPEVICNHPYIRVGQDCCLDKNSNAICDKDETTNPAQTTTTIKKNTTKTNATSTTIKTANVTAKTNSTNTTTTLKTTTTKPPSTTIKTTTTVKPTTTTVKQTTTTKTSTTTLPPADTCTENDDCGPITYGSLTCLDNTVRTTQTVSYCDFFKKRCLGRTEQFSVTKCDSKTERCVAGLGCRKEGDLGYVPREYTAGIEINNADWSKDDFWGYTFKLHNITYDAGGFAVEVKYYVHTPGNKTLPLTLTESAQNTVEDVVIFTYLGPQRWEGKQYITLYMYSKSHYRK
ncbi:Uncharacterised protein [uncultured archaeon]|nr:Uncharacterised protein [uncultured archaeon]